MESISLLDLQAQQGDDAIVAEPTGPLFDVDLYEKGRANIRKLISILNDKEILWHCEGMNPLHFIVRKLSDVDETSLRHLVNKGGHFILSDTTEGGNTAAHLAIILRKPNILRALLKQELRKEMANLPISQVTLRNDLGNNVFHELLFAYESCEDEELWTEYLSILMNSFKWNEEKLEFIDTAINQVNGKGLTPVHLAGRFVCCKGMKKLLPFYWERAPFNDDIKGPSLLHYMCGLSYYNPADGEDPCARLQLFLAVLKNSRKTKFSAILNFPQDGFSPLENAIVHLQPVIVKLLLPIKELELNCKVATEWKPLGLAAMNGGSKEAKECFHLIIKHARKKVKKFNDEIYQSRTNEPSVLEYVMDYCGQGEIDLLLRSTLPNDGYTRQKQLEKAKHSARVQETLIRLSVCYEELHENVVVPQIQNNVQNNNTIPAQQSKETLPKHDKMKTLAFDVGAITGQYEKIDGPETLKLVKSLQKWGRKETEIVLGNPALRYFLRIKYQKLNGFMYCALVMQLAWLLVLGFLSAQFKDGDQSYGFLKIVALVYTLCSVVFEILEIAKLKWGYPFHFTNYAQWARSLAICVSIVLHPHCKEGGQALYSIGLLAAALVSMRHLRNLAECIGQSVDIFFQVVKIVLSVFLGCCLLWLSFYAGWMILFAGDTFRDNPLLSVNRSGVIPLMATLIMMTGEIDGDAIADALDPGVSDALMFTIVMRNIFFILFLICIVFAFFNQLTGVALAEVQVMMDRATIQRIAWKIEYAFLVETFVYGLCYIFPCIFPPFVEYCVASKNNQEGEINSVIIIFPPKVDRVKKPWYKLFRFFEHFPGIERFTEKDYADLFTFASENQEFNSK